MKEVSVSNSQYVRLCLRESKTQGHWTSLQQFLNSQVQRGGDLQPLAQCKHFTRQGVQKGANSCLCFQNLRLMNGQPAQCGIDLNNEGVVRLTNWPHLQTFPSAYEKEVEPIKKKPKTVNTTCRVDGGLKH